MEKHFPFMICYKLYGIKTRDKMKVDTSILLFLGFLLGVYAMRFIYMVIVKEIVFTCVIYTTILNVIFLFLRDLSPAMIWKGV